MIAGGRGGKMPCESCSVQFSVFKRKRVCCECERYYCSSCLRRGGGAMCAPCRVLSTRPLFRNTIAHLKVRDLQCFLQRQNVSTRGCVEKEELVNLCVTHVNGASYRRRGARSSGAFSSIKGITNNINNFLNNAFDLRSNDAPPPSQPTQPQPQAQPQSRDCFNTTHAHHPAPRAAHVTPERFTTTPSGERDIEVPVPPEAPASTPSVGSAVLDTADCFEVEDLDDAGWEFVTRPADPLPNDSDILISMADAGRRDSSPAERAPAEQRGGGARLSADYDFERIPDPGDARPGGAGLLAPGLSAGARASSELELRSAAAADTADTASLKDELEDRAPRSGPATPRRVTLEQMKSAAELEALSVKQLKELLARNRVEFRGCIERADLLARAQLLWRDHAAYRAEVDNLPLEECCKICMAAPLECVLLECGHIAACTACSKQLAECPICRQYVVRAVRFFRS